MSIECDLKQDAFLASCVLVSMFVPGSLWKNGARNLFKFS